MPKSSGNTPAECPICGSDVPPGAKACPGCGADEQTGWNEEATRYDALDLPDDSFDYEETMHRERPNLVPVGLSVFWWSVGIAVLAWILYVWVV